ncbi:YveK family protein [Paenibacillus eucommiae]|uniref:Capsular polysaccharide biosynthesis protein n=1 Tax=Paenibacillus eucommiae TaxID=1355755 RepID=A0ABS4ITF0_9BACL|nr:Wzz/FepE/Etk N-terminal domain-containing protein [Paenibacillus eucommiae]MBP1990301.1 capsular polysaccharide biosynthesis protein [Paenibacillus eucommiae]
MELKQYGAVLRKRMWLILAMVVVSSLAAGLYSYYLITPKYQASTKLIVNKTRDVNALTNNLDLGTINLNIQLIKTYKEIIKTERIMGKVAERYPDLKLTANDLISKVSVSSVNDTQLMSVSAVDVSYEKAADIVNAVSKVFQEETPGLMQIDNIAILSEAKRNVVPTQVSPNPKLNIAIAFLISLMLGVGIALLLEYLDDTLKTEEDILKLLDMPTLSSIPKFMEKDLLKTKSITTVNDFQGRVKDGSAKA